MSGANSYQRVKNRTVTRSFKIGPVSLNFITITIVSLLALFYLIQSQQTANKGYRIKELEEVKATATAQNEDLQIQNTQSKSIENIKNTAESLGMVQAKEINYLDSQTLTKK